MLRPSGSQALRGVGGPGLCPGTARGAPFPPRLEDFPAWNHAPFSLCLLLLPLNGNAFSPIPAKPVTSILPIAFMEKQKMT